MRGAEKRVVAADGLGQRATVQHVQIDGNHAVAPGQLAAGVARNGGDAVAPAQGFFQQLAACAAGGSDDGDVGHGGVLFK